MTDDHRSPWDLAGLGLALLLCAILGWCSQVEAADRATVPVEGGSETWLTAAPGVGYPDCVPVAYRLQVVPPSGPRLEGVCGTIPSYPAPWPWPHPIPESCSAHVRFDRPGYWTVVSVAWWLHESPDGAIYTYEDALLLLVDDGEIFADGFEGGDTARWRTQ
jgi:hypothetical protein